ncbi:hypothetical protein [Caballeronia glathei]|uniref:hypothetical protein n=1 Tax=Caballeronia glathei TaxID=60547 RepID=UPI0014700F63|nr:hypothetical protein [Caballeronia glathei]
MANAVRAYSAWSPLIPPVDFGPPKNAVPARAPFGFAVLGGDNGFVRSAPQSQRQPEERRHQFPADNANRATSMPNYDRTFCLTLSIFQRDDTNAANQETSPSPDRKVSARSALSSASII